jgi:hypothetical protein
VALCTFIANSEAWPILDAGGAEAFMEASDLGVIFVRGPATQATANAALMLRALRRELVGLLRVGVAAAHAEPMLQRRLALRCLPGIAFVGAGHVLACLGHAPCWEDYLEATDASLRRLAHHRAPPHRTDPVIAPGGRAEPIKHSGCFPKNAG